MSGIPRGVAGRASTLSIVALAYALAFAQRTGQTVADTRAELSVNPGLFLDRVSAVWSSTTDLGHVQSGQFVGYLMPMGPWFAGFDALGVPMWISQRLWFGTLLALAAWGVLRLMDALWERPRGIAHVGAALLFVCNPYVVQFASRGTVTLAAYAALPWLMLAAHRGLREPRSWRWPAFIGLVLGISGGGVNAAVIAFALLGPLALVAYEASVMGIGWRPVRSVAWRTGLCATAGSLWWAIPVMLQSGYGADFLRFTEQPGTIWGTTSLSESLRLLGFWVMYSGVGFGHLEPALPAGAEYLFDPVLIVAGFAVPLVATAGLALARRWRYAPFFGLLLVATLLVMFAGFPEGTPLRRALTFTYNHVSSVQFLRTTYKAAPLLALALSCLGGVAAAGLVDRARSGTLRVPVPVVIGCLGVLPVLFAWPLFSARAVDPLLSYGSVPAYWKRAIAEVDRPAAASTRVMVLPGEQFAYYRWGGTVDPVAPALSRRPVAIREVVPYADQRSSQLQETVDDLVQQGRLLPGQLRPLLSLMGVGDVLVAADGRINRSGALDPARTEETLRRGGGLRPLAAYGPFRTVLPPAGWGGDGARVPQLMRSRPLERGQPMVRVQPRAQTLILDGDAQGIAQLAATGGLDPSRAVRYAGDMSAAELRRDARRGTTLVLTDSNRRRVVNAARLRARYGPTLAAGTPISADSPTFDLFSGGDQTRTVAEYRGLRSLYAPLSPGYAIFPEHRAFAALDGRTGTSWIADANLDQAQRYLELSLARPRRVRAIRILGHVDARGRTASLELTVNGTGSRRVELRPGWNTVGLGDQVLRSLRVRVAHVARVQGGDDRVGGGIDELRIPGVEVSEALRLPESTAGALRGADLRRTTIRVLLSRTTADFPWRAGNDVGAPVARSELDMVDAESGMQRIVTLPERRTITARGWGSVSPDASDPAIDAMVGGTGGWTFASSSRFEGVAGRRASSAFDRDPRTAWIGNRVRGRRPPWLEFRAPRSVRVRRVRLRSGPAAYATPARVLVTADGAAPRSVAVGADGLVTLPRAVSVRRLRMTVTAVRPARDRSRGLRAVAISEVRLPGVRTPVPRVSGSIVARCGSLSVSANRSRLRLAPVGSVPALNAGEPLRIRSCRGAVTLGAGRSLVSAPPGRVLRPDVLALESAAPQPPVAAASAGRVLQQGHGEQGKRSGTVLRLTQPGWLVLGESWSRGWRAWCSDAAGRERALGASLPIDGFANGWRVGPWCQRARFAFAPQRIADGAYLASVIGALLLLGLLGTSAMRARRGSVPRASGRLDAWLDVDPPQPPVRLGLGRALVAGTLAGVVIGVVFALRAGVVAAPVVASLLLWGVNAQRLLRIALAALAALPVIYVLFPATNRGGFNFRYPVELLAAHWVAVAAVLALAGAALLGAGAVRRAAGSSGSGSRSST